MPYVPDPATDDGRSGQSGSSGSSRVPTAAQTRRRDEPRGIARYFQPQPKGTSTQSQIPPPIPVPVHSPARHLNWTPSSGPPRPIFNPSAPSTPTLARTPSRIAVVINSSSQQKASQPISRDASEDSLEALKVTSDINQPRRAAPSTPNPATTSPMKPSSTTPRPPGRPPSTTTTPRAKLPSTVPRAGTATTATTTAATTQTPATQPPKRRGRPVGWRPGMGSYSAKASFPGAPRTATKEPRTGPPKRRGRPPGRTGLKPTRAIFEKLRPQYVSFLCEWEGCPAELQNVDTLRRHVLVVHGREGAGGWCRWGKCSNQQAPLLLQRKRFGSEREFERHVEDRHLVPFVWHVGDGPRNTVMEYKVKTPDEAADDLPGYLFDAEGNQVTPSVLNQEFENDEERKERRRRLHRLLLERDRNAPEEVEMEEG